MPKNDHVTIQVIISQETHRQLAVLAAKYGEHRAVVYSWALAVATENPSALRELSSKLQMARIGSTVMAKLEEGEE